MVRWTDWGVPTLAFDIYLTGYDVQTLNLRDLFAGNLPMTVPDTSPRVSLRHARLRHQRTGGAPDGPYGPEIAYLLAAHTGQTDREVGPPASAQEASARTPIW